MGGNAIEGAANAGTGMVKAAEGWSNIGVGVNQMTKGDIL